MTPYTRARLSAFFGVSEGESYTINVTTPQPRQPAITGSEKFQCMDTMFINAIRPGMSSSAKEI
jgi:hypothetical protein